MALAFISMALWKIVEYLGGFKSIIFKDTLKTMNTKMTQHEKKLPKLLFVTRVFPIENSTGARSYVLDILKYFKGKGFEIEIAVVDSYIGGRSPVFVIPNSILKLADVSFNHHFRIGRMLFRKRTIVDFILIPIGLAYYLLPESKREKIVNLMDEIKYRISSILERQFAARTHMPLVKDDLAEPEEIEMVKRRIGVFKPDVVIANYAWLTGVFDAFLNNSSILKMVLTHDAIHQRVEMANRMNITWTTSKWTPEKEAALLAKADVVLSIQKEEASEFKEMKLIKEVIYAPISSIPKKPKNNQVPGRCLFVGSKGASNVQGVQWFLSEVWPIVLSEVPHGYFHVCGTVCNKITGEYPNTRFLGRIDSLAFEYGAAEVCLLPLHFGSGLKIKLVEALSYGRACVSTTIGIQGMAELKNKAVIVADSSDQFASSVIAMLSDSSRRREMEREAHRFIKERLSPEIVYQPIINRIGEHLVQSQKI